MSAYGDLAVLRYLNIALHASSESGTRRPPAHPHQPDESRPADEASRPEAA